MEKLWRRFDGEEGRWKFFWLLLLVPIKLIFALQLTATTNKHSDRLRILAKMVLKLFYINL